MMEQNNMGITGFNYSDLSFDFLTRYNIGDTIKILLKDDDYDSYADLTIIEKEDGDYYSGPRILVMINNEEKRIVKWYAKFNEDATYIPETSFISIDPNIAGFYYSHYIVTDPKNPEKEFTHSIYHKTISFKELKQDPVGTVYECKNPTDNYFYTLIFGQSCKLMYKNNSGSLLRYITTACCGSDIDFTEFVQKSQIVEINYIWIDFTEFVKKSQIIDCEM